MTYIEREEMFSKDYLTIKDVEKLLGLEYNEAAKQIRDIKRGLEMKGRTLRLKMQGRLHVQDYLDYFGLSAERYGGGCTPHQSTGLTASTQGEAVRVNLCEVIV